MWRGVPDTHLSPLVCCASVPAQLYQENGAEVGGTGILPSLPSPPAFPQEVRTHKETGSL